MSSCRRDGCDPRDRGAASVEFAVIFGFFVLFAALVLFAGSMAQATIDVGRAAQEAARAGSLERSEPAAIAAARSAAETAVTAGECVGGVQVSVDSSNFGPGGSVSVTVTCTTSGVGEIGGRTVTGSATELIDVYRSEP